MTITLTGSLYFTSVAISPINIVKPPSPTMHTTCLPGTRPPRQCCRAVRSPWLPANRTARTSYLRAFRCSGRSRSQLSRYRKKRLRRHREACLGVHVTTWGFIGLSFARASFLHQLVPFLHIVLSRLQKILVFLFSEPTAKASAIPNDIHPPSQHQRDGASQSGPDLCRSGLFLHFLAWDKTPCRGTRFRQ